jgi:cytochrome b561
MSETEDSSRSGLGFRILAFFLGFGVILLVVARYFIYPATRAAVDADPSQRTRLAAYAALLMFVLLALLVAGMILVFRWGRLFHRNEASRSKTKYSDAWEESGRRARGDG